MTPAQQTELWHKYNTFRLRKVRAYIPAINKSLKAQLQFYADNRNIDLIPMQPIADVIKALYLDAGRLYAHQSYLNVIQQSGRKNFFVGMQTKTRMPIGFNEDFINSILQYFQLRLLNEAVLPITETTKDFIRNALNKGIAEGLGIDEIVRDILQSDITKIRAELIARTEIMKAANYGEQLGADKTGLQTNKIWIAVRDNRTRFDHAETDGQIVPDGKPFSVGLEHYEMQRPGDGVSADGRKVPAKEIVNCRCVIGRKVLRGANGLPLRSEAINFTDERQITNEEELSAIKSYTEENYAAINNYLRGFKSTISEDNQKTIDDLSYFLQKAPKTPGISYRGIALSEYDKDAFISSLSKGSIFNDKGFTSTSVDKNQALKFGDRDRVKCLVTIEGKTGVSIAEFSDLQEKEILFDKGTKMIIK